MSQCEFISNWIDVDVDVDVELMLRWAKINLFKVFRRYVFRIFCGFNFGCPDEVVSFKLAEIFDSSEPDTSTSIKLYTNSLT